MPKGSKKAKADEPRVNTSLAVLPPPPPRARPAFYTDEIAEAICERIADGETLTRICLDEDMPARRTVSKWLLDRPEFEARYTRARALQAHVEVDEILDIADDSGADYHIEMTEKGPRVVFDGEHVQRTKIRIDTRIWRAGRLNRRAYGDKVSHEIEPTDGSTPAGQELLPSGLGFLAGKLPSADAA